MLDDREASVASVRAIGAELTTQANDAEKAQVEAEVATLMTRWQRLRDFSDQRQRDMDAMLQVRDHVCVYLYCQRSFLKVNFEKLVLSDDVKCRCY